MFFFYNIPNELPSIKKIKHHIDLAPIASISNLSAYQSNLKETKKL